MKVVLDVFGADEPPNIIIDGALLALKEDNELFVALSGDQDIILPILKSKNADMSKLEIIDAKEVITNDDAPTTAFKVKKESSLIKGLQSLKDRDDLVAFVSAGSTGAVLTGATFIVKRIEGVMRPALAPLLPTATGGQVCLVDGGANVDCKKEYLAQFAILGSAYIEAANGIKKPSIGLVSVGAEDKKGNELTKGAFAILKEMPINFKGNVEARYALSGDLDVLVCDGFVGNVLLKSVEGTAKLFSLKIKQNIKASFMAKIGYAIFMRGAFKRLKNSMDYQKHGGAPFLGVEKVVIKCHGSSKASAIKAAVLQAKTIAKAGLIEKIKEGLKSANFAENSN
ncbi:MAG: phosphate acyltransferase PlsX [Firmicutes bacterium]|nr:phosphate acyltransferase PlsX [Bacillota bacterium]